mmetsp:Transcript_108528/g.346365  ORF Transcript_108528/g.346365 Transcript_108528/m.346365 type:complete len:504 (-) Transcript_108528:73-1584(-)
MSLAAAAFAEGVPWAQLASAAAVAGTGRSRFAAGVERSPAPAASLRGGGRSASSTGRPTAGGGTTSWVEPATASLVGAAALVSGSRARRRHQRRQQPQPRGTLSRVAAAEGGAGGQAYFNFTGFPFPLGPLFERQTVRREIGDGMWSFEQEQSLANIAVNVRMTVIRLKCGGLWVHNPVAPTAQCTELLRALGAPVKFIVLGCAQYEHKIFVGPFARRWPDAKVYITPQQWSWPIDLPSQLYGIFPVGELRDADADAPWADEIDQRLLNPTNRLGFGYSAAECAFFHRRSKTLICTDALVYVPEEPPSVLSRSDLTNLGKTADNIVLDLVALANWRGSGEAVREAQRTEAASTSVDERALLKKGWQRDALLALYFGPDGRSIIDPTEAFRAIAGRWLVGPVCYSLVYGGVIREDVSKWAERLCEWDIQQILPCHFAGPVRGTRDDVRQAFEVLKRAEADVETEDAGSGVALPWPFPQPPIKYRPQDLQLLANLRSILKALRVI